MTAAPVLVVIPARGGSKGIPRKNLRRLGGRPLIAHAIEIARSSRHEPTVVVTSDDDEILAIARTLGATTLRRAAELSGDDATLDGTVHDAYRRAASDSAVPYEIVATVQPTSPLIRTATLDRAIDRLIEDPGLDTVISAADDRHLRWVRESGEYQPAYAERRNRQYLPEAFRETGGFLVTRAQHVTPESRIGPRVSLEVVEGAEAIDIDTIEDFLLCEAHLARRRVAFVVAGHPEIGLGHTQNALTLAHDFVSHELVFVVPDGHDLAAEVIRAHHYTVLRQEGTSLDQVVMGVEPDVVINDILDTDEAYVRSLKAGGAVVINFEDLGDGARHADLVVNAIYPEREALPNHHFGPRYFLARSEFLLGPEPELRPSVDRVLVTFGGTDPADLTRRVIDAIAPYCGERSIAIDVVLGRGYAHDRPRSSGVVTVHDSVGNMAEFMRQADVAFTSAGRTVFELALVGVPSVILAQNDRELTHLFASAENGFLNLGRGDSCPPARVLDALARLVADPAFRRRMHDLMRMTDLRGGRERVVSLVEDAIISR